MAIVESPTTQYPLIKINYINECRYKYILIKSIKVTAFLNDHFYWAQEIKIFIILCL